MKKPFAARLNQRIAFDEPVEQSDGQGGVHNGWREVLCCYAGYRFLRGSEVVQAARLAGRQPVVITVRAMDEVAQARPEWRIRDVSTGGVYNIRSIVPTDDRRFLEITAESGVAV